MKRREHEEIRRNPQKHPSKDPKQYAETPKQKHSLLRLKVENRSHY